MSHLIPETALRLQAAAFVCSAELEAVGRDHIIRAAALKMAETCLRKLLQDCIKVEGGYRGYQGQYLHLDVYVLSPQELHQIIVEAQNRGAQDALQWGAASFPHIVKEK